MNYNNILIFVVRPQFNTNEQESLKFPNFLANNIFFHVLWRNDYPLEWRDLY